MNNLASSGIWALAGAVLGVFADMALFRVILPFNQAILHWLATFDNQHVTHYAFRLWILLPTFLVALLAGVISGHYVRHRLIFKLMLFGFGFMLAPIIVEFIWGYTQGYTQTFEDWGSFLTVEFHRAILTAIALSSAYLSHRLPRERSHEQRTAA